MASSTSQHSSFFHLPLSSHPVDMNTASHPPPTSSSLPQPILPEFHPHSSFPNLRQNRSPEWQPPVNADESFHSSLMTPFSSPAGARARLQDVGITPAAASLPSYGNPLPCTGGWEMGLQQKIAYTSSLPSLLPACNLPLPRSIEISSRGTPDGSSAKEFGALAGNAMFSEGVLSTQSAMGFGASGIEKMSRLGSSWNSVNAASNLSLTLDASKGRLSIQGANPAASHCLANFTSEPGFAERAARFSSYCTQGYSELATSFPLTEGGKTLPRSSPHPYDGPPVNKLTRVSSCPPSRCRTPSSPSGNLAAGELQDANGVQENFLGQACQELTGGTEHGKCIDKLRGRASYSPSVVETDDEEAQKYGTSVDEPDELGVGVGNEESSSSEQGVRHTGEQALTSNSCKKRKNGLKENSSKEVLRVTPPISAGKEPKDAEEDEAIGKRHKNGDSDTDKEKLKSKVEQSNSGNSGESTPKSIKESSHPADQSKPDYIHVRARRGQATDSHSLAERVRREKISERMKFLQDLVPGCSKVTGKAVMLDEIINYVQSLQRQVEFLSMKLAAVNPRPDCNVESFFNKELMQPRAGSPSLLFAPESMNAYNQIHPPLQARVQAGMACGGDANGSVADSLLRRRMGASRQLAAMDAYGDSLSQQAWDDELQTVVQMGSGQGGGRLTDVAPQCPSGRLPCSQL